MWPSFKDLRQPIKLVLVSRRGAIYCVAQEALAERPLGTRSLEAPSFRLGRLTLSAERRDLRTTL